MALPDLFALRPHGFPGCAFPRLRGRRGPSCGARERVLPSRHERLQRECFERAAPREKRQRRGDGETEEHGRERDDGCPGERGRRVQGCQQRVCRAQRRGHGGFDELGARRGVEAAVGDGAQAVVAVEQQERPQLRHCGRGGREVTVDGCLCNLHVPSDSR